MVTVLKEICNSYDAAEDLLKTINGKIEEICSHEKLFIEDLIYFHYLHFVLAFFSIKVSKSLYVANRTYRFC